MYSKFLLSYFLIVSIFSSLTTTPVVKKKDLCDESLKGKSQGNLRGANRTEPVSKSHEPKSSGKQLNRSYNGGLSEGINLETNLNLCESSHGTVMQTLAEDNSQLTVFSTMFRQQSNEAIKNSDLKEDDVVFFVPKLIIDNFLSFTFHQAHFIHQYPIHLANEIHEILPKIHMLDKSVNTSME